MRLLLLVFVSAPSPVEPFAALSSTSTIAAATAAIPPLHASSGRDGVGGGAMSRRRKPIIRIDDDDDDDNDDEGEEIAARLEKRPTPDESSSSSSSNGGGGGGGSAIYSHPPLYDLAFGYRCYEDEVSSLLSMHDLHSNIVVNGGGGGDPSSSSSSSSSKGKSSLRLLELAAGPARHSIAALSHYPKGRIDSVLAMDVSSDMVEYGTSNADVDLGDGYDGGDRRRRRRRDDFRYVVGDMRRASDHVASAGMGTPSSSFDSAWLLLGSMQHLLTNDDAISCLSSIGETMKCGGTVIIELPHPRETFKMGECTTNGWTVPLVEGEVDDDDDGEYDGEDGEDGKDGNGGEREYGELNIVWGEEGDEFDPVTQVRQFTIGLELIVKDGANDVPTDGDDGTSALLARMKADGTTGVREIVPLRLYTMQEIDALGRVAGFDLVGRYGALEGDVSIDDEDEAFRMICVLRKK